MVKDFNALKTALETDARYDTAVVAGNNGEVVRLLNELEPSQIFIRDLTRGEVLTALGDSIRVLTAQQLQRLRLLVDDVLVRVSDPVIRGEIVDVLGAGSDGVARLTVAATQNRTYGGAFGFEQASLQEVRQVVARVAKALINQ